MLAALRRLGFTLAVEGNESLITSQGCDVTVILKCEYCCWMEDGLEEAGGDGEDS